MKRRDFLQLMVALAGVPFLAKAKVEAPRRSSIPIGTLMPYCGDKVPPGWLPCDGRVISQNHYPELFKIIEQLPDMNAAPSGLQHLIKAT